MNDRTSDTGGQRPDSGPVRSDKPIESPLFSLLRTTSWLKGILETSSVACISFARLIGLALLTVCIDALFSLSPAARMSLNCVLAASLIGAFVLAVRTVLLNRFNPRRTARLIEERLQNDDSSFINAVEFSSTLPGGQSTRLRERVIRIADQRAGDISLLDVIPLRPLFKAFALVAVACAVLVGIHLTAPRLLAMVVPRFVDPLGDHPPFTLIDFDVQITPQPVFHGKAAAIDAVLTGPEMVDQAAVVFIGDGTGERESVPMFRKKDQHFSLQIEKAEQSRAFYIDTPSGRSETLMFEVLEIPFFEKVSVAYRYPEYTHWSPDEKLLGRKGLQAIMGTEITVTVESNLPLKSGRLALSKKENPRQAVRKSDHGKADNAVAVAGDATEADEVVTLLPIGDDARTVRGTFRLSHSGQFALSLRATSGAESLEALEGPLSAIPDRAPHVAIIEPAPNVVVPENWPVPVVIEALDDIDISQMRIYRSVNGWGPTPLELPFEKARGNAVQSTYTFDLPTLGARAGDVITYYASAWDNHPEPNQFRDTATYVIQVISREEYQQYARQQFQMEEMIAEMEAMREQLETLKKERDKMLEELETLRKEMENVDQPTDAMQEKMQGLEKQLTEYAESTEQLTQRLKERIEQTDLYEFEEPYKEMLQRLTKELEQQSENASAVSQSLSKMAQPEGLDQPNREQFRQALQKFQEEDKPFDEQTRQQLDAAEQDLETYRQADNLMAAAERLRLVISRQRQLADRLAEFQNRESLSADDQARADQFAGEQERLEQELQEVVEQMQQAADEALEKLPQMSADASKLCEAIQQQNIQEDQQSAAQQARQGAGRDAWKGAESAAKKLESLLSDCPDCDKACEGMCQSMDGPLKLPKDRLKQCMNQLAQGRSIPGMGKPGSGSGQGEAGSGQLGRSGMGGQAAGGTGEAAAWRPGQSFSGSQAPVTILGPHAQKGEQQKRSGGRLGNDGRGSWVPIGARLDPNVAESLTAESADFGSSAAGNLRGVPVGYRKAAEAYFKRLAEGK